jgi:hypothetical protein
VLQSRIDLLQLRIREGNNIWLRLQLLSFGLYCAKFKRYNINGSGSRKMMRLQQRFWLPNTGCANTLATTLRKKEEKYVLYLRFRVVKYQNLYLYSIPSENSIISVGLSIASKYLKTIMQAHSSVEKAGLIGLVKLRYVS